MLTIINFSVFSQQDNTKAIHTMKVVKMVSYKAENNTLITNRDSLFSSRINASTHYNKEGFMVMSRKYDNEGKLYSQRSYMLKESGDVRLITSKNQDEEILSYTVYEYNDADHLISITTYDPKKDLTQIQRYQNDKDGNRVQMVVENIHLGTTWKHQYVYNEKGEKVEQFRYQSNGDLKDRRTYVYDYRGNEVEQFKYNPDGRVFQFLSTYDLHDNLLVQNWFNEAGQQIHQTSFEYIYDDFGNWISKRRSSNGELNMVWERKIEYYEN